MLSDFQDLLRCMATALILAVVLFGPVLVVRKIRRRPLLSSPPPPRGRDRWTMLFAFVLFSAVSFGCLRDDKPSYAAFFLLFALASLVLFFLIPRVLDSSKSSAPDKTTGANHGSAERLF